MVEILMNIFWLVKIKKKRFGICYHNRIFFHVYNDLIKMLQTFLVISLCRYKDIVFVWFHFLKFV